ncbi:MAG: hypothetical protein ABSD98_06125 [Candidatus Korobacteraceae bacterium]|jgi:hypothetical protein
MNHDADERDCDIAGQNTNSPSFAEGCKSAVGVKAWIAARQQLTPLLQSYDLGMQFAKANRALPTDCNQIYQSIVTSEAYKSLATTQAQLPLLTTLFRSGCLEQAKKQAKRIIKEDEKRARQADKEAKKHAQSPK